MINFKRSTALVLVAILLVLQLPFQVLAAGNRGIIVTSVEIKDKNGKTLNYDDRLYEGDRFSLVLEFEYTGKAPTNPMVEINKSNSFNLTSSGAKKKINFNSSTISKPLEFSLTYTGNEDRQLPITIYYSLPGGEEIAVEDYVSIPQARKTVEKEDKEDQEEKSQTPNISVVGGKTSLGKAGDRLRLPVKIKNTSDARAYNLSVSLELEDSQGLFIDGSGYEDFSKLNSGSEKNLDFYVQLDKFAEEKTYPLKLVFHYYNSRDEHFTNTDTIYLRVEGRGEDSQIIVDEVKFSRDVIKVGDIIVIDFNIRNLSMIPVRDLKISIDGLETDKFTLSSGTNRATLPYLRGKGFHTVRFPIKISKKLKTGYHGLKLNVGYKNLRGKDLEEVHDFFIPVKGEGSQNSSLIIENIKLPSSIGPNQTANINFNVRNRGQEEARDIIVKAELPDADGLVPKSVSTIKLDSLEPGASKNMNFSFYATKKTPTKNYPINIKLEHIDDLSEGDDKYNLDQFLGIFVDNPAVDDDGKKSTPKLIIDKYSFSSEMIEAGKNFDMKLSFYNTNSSKSVNNIKIYLTAEDNVAEGENTASSGSSVFSPVNSSNTFYIDSIPPKGRVEKNITMFTIPSAAAKTHIITANFEYEDSEFEEYKATELIGVPVVQKSRLEVAELNYFPESALGEPVPISVEFYNTGKSTLYNMMVRLEGDFQTENGSYYIGNFAPGTSESFDGTVIPSMEGRLEGNVVFSFEDSLGEVQEIKRPFSLNITEAFDDEFPDMPMEPEKTLMQKLKWPLVLILALVAGLFARKFYKKRKQRKEDEDLLDE